MNEALNLCRLVLWQRSGSLADLAPALLACRPVIDDSLEHLGHRGIVQLPNDPIQARNAEIEAPFLLKTCGEKLS